MLDEVDVLIIGSGHSGGMAAKVLTEMATFDDAGVSGPSDADTEVTTG